MLNLQTSKYRNTYEGGYYYMSGSSYHLECSDDGNARLQGHQYYFRGAAPIYTADLPLHMNQIGFSRNYFRFDEDFEGDHSEIINSIKDKLLETFNVCPDDHVCFITAYLAGTSLENKDYVYPFVDPDLWQEYKGDTVEALFNKCVEQTSLRESERQGRTIKQHIRVFKSRSKHMILMLTDYADSDQESETFLALGLVPVFFEDFKERFCQEEIDYFKCLVNRSQVKRISNVKATEMFRTLEDLEKYKALERQIRYKTLFNQIANARVNYAKQNVSNYQSQMERAMHDYDQALKKIAEYEILINKYKEDANEIVDELKTVANMQGMYDINQGSGDRIKMVLRVPLDYFDTDEAECAIRNEQDERVKRFINDIFIEQKYKLYIRTDMYYSYSSEADFQDFTSIDEDKCKEINAMFNPHFQFYHCLGSYRPELIKAMREQDITLFTNIGIAAARSMNFKDGAVCSRWFRWLSNAFDNDYYLAFKCLEKDGQQYTLYDWLHETQGETPEVNVIEPEEL